jgi:hypothetical protein
MVGNTLWQDSICLEMVKIWIAFQILNDDASIPLTYQEIYCHMACNMKMEDFTHKAWFIAGGHMIETPATNTYVSVKSQESQYASHWATLAALNDLEVNIADIKNAGFGEDMVCLRARDWCRHRQMCYCSTVAIWPEACLCIILKSPSTLYAAPRMGVMYCWSRPLDKGRD